jgi:hypothetical protein
MPAAPPPTKSLVTVQDGFDFMRFADFFSGIMAFAADIFDSYYTLVREVRKGAADSSIKLANDGLLERLQAQGWTTTLPKSLTYLAFVCAYRPDTTDFNPSPENLIRYYKALPVDPIHFAEKLAKLSFDKAEVGQFLRDQAINLPYPVTKSEEGQAGYRIVSSDFSGTPTFIFNPVHLYKLDRLYQKT